MSWETVQASEKPARRGCEEPEERLAGMEGGTSGTMLQFAGSTIRRLKWVRIGAKGASQCTRRVDDRQREGRALDSLKVAASGAGTANECRGIWGGSWLLWAEEDPHPALWADFSLGEKWGEIGFVEDPHPALWADFSLGEKWGGLGEKCSGMGCFFGVEVGWCGLRRTLIRPIGPTSPSGRSGEGLWGEVQRDGLFLGW